jgi:signal transduction histidine kinase
MRFSTFIMESLDPIVDEWVVYARQVSPAGSKLSEPALADHSREILTAIAHDMEVAQDEAARQTRSEGNAPGPLDAQGQTAATAHGAVRQLYGFDLDQMVSEYRALRATVLKRWRDAPQAEGDRAEAVEEIARFNEGIDQALAESVKQYTKDVAKSRDLFLGVLGHDLRGPLSSIANSAATLALPEASPAVRQQAQDRIGRSMTRMTGLISDLLDYTQTRSGHGLTVSPSTCDLRKVCDEAVDAMKAAHPDREFTCSVSGDLVLQADKRRIEQALANLLNNAVQYSGSSDPISLAAEGDADTVCIRVKNLGTPISPESLPTIFEPLVQGSNAHGTRDRSASSIGLGLFIVREIVRGHRGTIDVASSQAAGTVFTVQLPRTLET